VLGRPEATVLEWDDDVLSGAGFVASIHRVSGVAVDGDERLRWSVIRKSVANAHDRVDDLRYWKREPLAYGSDVLRGLRSVRTPRCFEITEDDTGVVLWLEDVPDDGGAATVERVASVAGALGALTGEGAVQGEPPADPWLSRGWNRRWVEQAAPAFSGFETAVRDPLLARLYPPLVAKGVAELWRARNDIFDALEVWPQVLSHLDAVPANVIVHDGEVVLIDWAFVGLAAAGEDLAPLVGGSPLFGGPPAQQLPRLDDMAFSAYIAGLRAAGWVGDTAFVRFAYAATAALRYGVAPAAFWVCGANPDGSIADVGGIRDPNQRELLSTILGRPFEHLMDIQTRSLAFLTTALGTEALELLSRVR
jgi:hypothetical protein